MISNYYNKTYIDGQLGLQAPLNNASFTRNIGINLLSTDTLDTALLFKEQEMTAQQKKVLEWATRRM